MLYQQGDVSVDLNFARFGAKSYAINKINTVEVRNRRPYGQGLPFLFGIIAFACFMTILMDGIGAGSAIGLLLFGALAYWAWQRQKTVEYSLFLMTSSSEAQALSTRDQTEVMGLRDAIETAMTRQHERAVHVQHSMHIPGDGSEMKEAKPASIRQRLLG